MKNTKGTKTVKAVKVLGFFRKGTALGDLAQVLADGKQHKLGHTLTTIRKRHKLVSTWRGYGVLRTIGKSKRAFSIVVDRGEDVIQLKGGRKQPGPKKVASKAVSQPVSNVA